MDSATRSVIALVGLAALGALWSAAWGARRAQRRAQRPLIGTRALALVHLDALLAHARSLEERSDLPDRARALVERALRHHEEALAAVTLAANGDEVDAAVPRIHEAMTDLSEAGAQVGQEISPHAPFAGLCASDPAHGYVLAADSEPLCPSCVDRALSGESVEPRMVLVHGRPVPFDEAAPFS